MTQKTKTDILFLSHRYEVTSGGEKALLDMLKYLVSIDIRPHVIIGDSGNIIEHLDEISVPYSVVYLPFWVHSGNDPTPFEFTSLNPTVNTTLQLVDIITKLKPKLCVTNTMAMPWLGYASSITGVRHAWMIHELGTAGFSFKYAIGEEQTLRTIDSLSDKIFYNSRYTSSYYLPHFTLNKDVNIIYPAGDLAILENTSNPFTTNKLRLVCVGQLKRQKGQMDAVKAMHTLKKRGIEGELILVGGTEEVDYEKSIRDFIVTHNLTESVRLVGHIKNPSSYMKHSDVVLSCAVNESFGRVVVEAMLLEKAIVGADSAGTAEIINSPKYGLLYKPGDIDDLVKKIIHFANSSNFRQVSGENAKKVAFKRYSPKERYKPFLDYYKSDTKKHALDLSLLRASFIDFSRTVIMYKNTNNTILAIEQSLAYRLLRKIRRLFGK